MMGRSGSARDRVDLIRGGSWLPYCECEIELRNEVLEMKLAEKLRRRGYAVWSN